MNLESALLLLLVAVVAVAFYCLQRTLLEILRTLRLINVKALNGSLFRKAEANLVPEVALCSTNSLCVQSRFCS
jgi:hypothetical protein